MITKMHDEDIDRCIDIVRDTMGDQLAYACSEGIGYHMDTRIIWVDEADQVVYGLGGYVPDEYRTDTCWVAWFAVDPDRQGQGIGTELLAKAQEMARDAGYTRMCVTCFDSHTFSRAREFYTENGFTPIGLCKDRLETGVNEVVYEARL